MSEAYFDTYIKILKKELVLAMGCTEPIAVAYCAAKAREVLGTLPKKVSIYASGNIIKNVKSVFVPHTGGLRGLEAAAAVGILYGNSDAGLNCLADITEKQEQSIPSQMEKMSFTVKSIESENVLDILIILETESESSLVRIEDEHTNITTIKHNDEYVFLKDKTKKIETNDELDYSCLLVDRIFEFANQVDLSLVHDILQRQIECNMAIANQGILKPYGAQIGRTLLSMDTSIKTVAKAYAAAGSDARMNGCELPVVICSGSGNQGITTSVPVIKYAQFYMKSEEELYRSLLVSNLVTLHLKSGIGRLSAYCGAISAGAGAGAGIAYMMTGDLETIKHTIVNTIATSSGVICDGAKASCAAKISLAVDTGIFGFEMYKNGNHFFGGDGIVEKGIENTIQNVAVLGHFGMKETDKTIIEIMTK